MEPTSSDRSSASPLADLLPPPRVAPLRRLGRLLRRFAPFAVWLAAAAGALLLYVQRPEADHALGFGEIHEVTAASGASGRIATVEVELGQVVDAGDVIATLDTREIEAQLRFAHARLERARTQIDAVEAQLRIEQDERRAQAASRRASHEAEGRRLRAEIGRLTGLETVDRTEMLGLDPQIQRIRPLVEKKLMQAERLEDLVQARNVLESRLETTADQLAASRRELREWDALAPQPLVDSDVRAHLVPLELELDVQEARVAALQIQLESANVLAPASGTVNAIVGHPGEWCEAGAPIVELVVPSTDRVTAFLTGPQVSAVAAGTRAAVRPRDRGGAALEGRVVTVAARVDSIPQQLRLVPALPEWGRLVTIVLDDPVDTVPGEVYRVSFR